MGVKIEAIYEGCIYGLLIQCSPDQRKVFVHTWANEILELAQAKGIDTDDPNFILLSIGLVACGGRANYHTVDDIPLVDVPCPCGDPNHWLIKYEDIDD